MKVTVRFCNRQTANGETTLTTIDAAGTLSAKKNGFKLQYTETDGATATVLIADNRVLFMRQGELSTRLVLEENKQHLCHCQTPYGEMTFPIETLQVSANLSNGGGSIRAVYVMETTKNEIEILVEEVPTC